MNAADRSSTQPASGAPSRPRSYARSEALYAEAQRYLAGGVSSNFRLGVPPLPLFFERAEGARLYDVDGNEYVDYMLGMGPVILGHNAPGPVRAAQEWLSKGQLFGGQSTAEIELGRRFCQAVPCADLVRFAGSGSEVVQLAFRLARAYTGRSKIIRFEGHYHGWMDSALVSTRPAPDEWGPPEAPRAVLGSRGQVPAAVEDVIVLPWNDAAVLRATLERRAREIAGVIMEPILCNTCVITPRPGYLETARDLCSRLGIVLIFDEVITGFRVALGGAQARLSVTPDLATFAKAIANGFPLAAVAGKREIMALLTDGVVHGGTYNAAPSTAAAAAATLDELARDEGAAYRRMEETGEALMEGLRQVAHRAGQPLLVQGVGQVFNTCFTDAPAIYDYREYTLRTDAARQLRFVHALADEGVRLTSRGTWFLSIAHTPDDVAVTIRAAERALARMS
jgi:glutamate-1-semialdehyde 2,1-aminomutase